MCYQNEPVRSFEYKGHTVNIYPDSHPEDPRGWGSLPPLVVVPCGRFERIQDPEDATGTILEAARAIPLKALIALSAEVLGEAEAADVLKEAQSDLHYHAPSTRREVIARCILDAIQEAAKDTRGSDHTAALATVAKAAGIAVYDGYTSGHSQGDYLDVLAVAAPAWIKEMGLESATPEELHSTLEQGIKTFGAWAWGDVHGYTVEGAEGLGCWGYYDDAHLDGDAREAIDYHMAKKREEHAQQVKRWIRGGAPLYARTPCHFAA